MAIMDKAISSNMDWSSDCVTEKEQSSRTCIASSSLKVCSLKQALRVIVGLNMKVSGVNLTIYPVIDQSLKLSNPTVESVSYVDIL